MPHTRAPSAPDASEISTRHDWYRITRNEATGTEPTSADVYIYEEIGERWWGGGVSAKRLAEQLDELDVDTIRLHLNSPGGAAYEGITIMNSLRRHKARVEVTVDGLAASAASIIAMAGDHVVMNRGSQMMVHDPWGYAIGNASEMRDYADYLDKLADSLADVYAARTIHDRAHWRQVMEAETWYTAEEAVDAGLADEWADAPDPADAQSSLTRQPHFDLTRFGYHYAGRAHAPAPRINPPDPPASSEPGTQPRGDVVAYDDLKGGLRERLGVTDADADDEVLIAALDEALAETAQSTDEVVPLDKNAMVVDRAAYEQLQADAAAGRAARDQQTRERRDMLVAAAVSDGRIAPSARDEWRKGLDENEERTSALLALLSKNTVPVGELGYALEGDETDGLYESIFGKDTH